MYFQSMKEYHSAFYSVTFKKISRQELNKVTFRPKTCCFINTCSATARIRIKITHITSLYTTFWKVKKINQVASIEGTHEYVGNK